MFVKFVAAFALSLGAVNSKKVVRAVARKEIAVVSANGRSVVRKRKHTTTTCQVTVYEHWPEGITSGMAGLEAAEAAWGGRFSTGASTVLNGTGNHALGALSNLVSSVKVEGTCCKAYGFTSADCSGTQGTAIESTTQTLASLPAGVVTPATGLAAVWGCNDCAQCVHVTDVCTSAPTSSPTSSYGSLLLDLKQSGIQSSGTWTDSSGNGYNAVNATSGVSFATETNGNYYNFDGSSGYSYIQNLHFQNSRIQAMELEIEFRTSFTGSSYTDNWSFLDFDRSEWFNAYVRGDNCYAMFSSTGTDGTNDELVGTTSLCDGQWHTMKVTFTTDGTTSSTQLFVNGVSEKTLSNKHTAGIGDQGTVRYGFIGEGSEATSQNGSRNSIYYHGDIRRVTLYATL